MSGFTPGRRFQPPYFPFSRRPLWERGLAMLERRVKGALFGCRMCGNCLLQETAFICPMECPKGLRNGPCGGSTPEGCYVDPTRPCIWHRIYERAERRGTDAEAARSAAAARLVANGPRDVGRGRAEGARAGPRRRGDEPRGTGREAPRVLGSALPRDPAARLVDGRRPAAPGAAAPAGFDARGEAGGRDSSS